MKKYSSWFLLLFLIFTSAPAVGLEVPALQGVVNDYAGLIAPEAKAKLENDLRAFEQSDSTQVVILTIPSLEGEDLEGFSIRVATTWKIGQQTKDNGVLLLVAKQERKIRIEVGKGLEGVLTDLLSGRIIDLVIKPNFKRGDYSGGFVAGVAAIIDATRGEFKGDAHRPAAQHKKGAPSFLTLLLFLGILLLFLGSLSRTFRRNNRRSRTALDNQSGIIPARVNGPDYSGSDRVRFGVYAARPFFRRPRFFRSRSLVRRRLLWVRGRRLERRELGWRVQRRWRRLRRRRGLGGLVKSTMGGCKLQVTG